MLKNFFSNSQPTEEHLPKEHLLMLVDGELPTKDASRAREHLETCWTCRGDLEKVENTISQFIEFRNKVQIPLSPSPPRKWDRFNAELIAVKEEVNTPKRPWLRLSDLSPFQLRIGIASVSVLVIFAMLLQILLVRPVSASELLQKAVAGQKARIAASSDPVVYQKLRITADGSEELSWEVWFDAEYSQAKQSVGNTKAGSDTIAELSAVLRRNKMDPERPLAPDSYRAWHESLEAKTDEITESGSITLKTTNNGTLGEIREATLKLRAEDLHPYEQIITTRNAVGTRTFTITEVNFEIVSRKTLSPGFFEGPANRPEVTANRDSAGR